MKQLKILLSMLVLSAGMANNAFSNIVLKGGVNSCKTSQGSNGTTNYTVFCGNKDETCMTYNDAGETSVNCNNCCVASGIYQNPHYATGAILSEIDKIGSATDITVSEVLNDQDHTHIGTVVTFTGRIAYPTNPISDFTLTADPTVNKTIDFTLTCAYSGDVIFEITNAQTSEKYQAKITCKEGQNTQEVVLPDTFSSGSCTIVLSIGDNQVSKTISVN